MPGCYNTRYMAKCNEATRGNASTSPDSPGNSRMKEERGHEAHARSYNTTTMQKLVSSSSHHSMELWQNQSGSALSEWPGSGHMTSNKARMMQMTALSMSDNYGAGNGPGTSGTLSNVPTTSNDARMVQTAAPSSLLSDNDAAPTGSGTAMFQNIKTM